MSTVSAAAPAPMAVAVAVATSAPVTTTTAPLSATLPTPSPAPAASTGRRTAGPKNQRADSTSWAQELQRYRPDKRLAAFSLSSTAAGGGGGGGMIIPAGSGASSSQLAGTAPVPASFETRRAYRDQRHNKQVEEFKVWCGWVLWCWGKRVCVSGVIGCDYGCWCGVV